MGLFKDAFKKQTVFTVIGGFQSSSGSNPGCYRSRFFRMCGLDLKV